VNKDGMTKMIAFGGRLTDYGIKALARCPLKIEIGKRNQKRVEWFHR